jgi:ankyrin repeat protein
MRTTKLLFLITLLAGILPSTFAGPLHDAAEKGDVAEVRRLLDEGADINAKEEQHGFTALVVAMDNGRSDVVKLLLEKGDGIDVSIKNKGGFDALHFAIMSGNTEVVAWLIKKGAKFTPQSRGNAVNWGTAEILSMIIDSGVNSDIKPKDDGMPLLFACICAARDPEEKVKTLLEKGANINVRYDGDTALTWAIRIRSDDNSALIKTLLAAGADVNEGGGRWSTPLMCAAMFSKPMCLTALLEAGADIDAKDADGHTVMSSVYCSRPATRPILEQALKKAQKRVDYWLKKNDFDDPDVTEALITAKNRQLPDFIATATNDQKVDLLTAVESQIARATATIDELNGQAADAIARKQDAAPYRARVGQVKAYINVLSEIKTILEQS